MQHPHPPVGARFSLLVLALLAFFLAVPAAATPADEAPRFLIEKITVAGNRRPASARIVVSESLLHEGRTYSEDELRDAIHRIKRLPFVIDADFALQKGSERGRYLLVVTVDETRLLFAAVPVELDTHGETISTAELRAPRHFDFGDSTLLGVRQFVGSEGLVFAALGSTNNLFQVGYTRYDLFGPGSFASATLAFGIPGSSAIPSLSVGLPLTANQSLRATVSRFERRSTLVSERRVAELDWLYNTTDDLFFPTRGKTAEADLFYRLPVVAAGEPDARQWTLALSGRSHRPLTARQSWSVGYEAAVDRFSGLRESLQPLYEYRASLDLRHALDLWQGESAHGRGDLRLETSIERAVFHADHDLSLALAVDPVYPYTLRSALVFRNPWAVVRLGVSYCGKAMR
ncbi:MAG TPA: hypothetical protein VGR07_09635 [Thermoanaerobaculia bacterium]|nr:hypothetical protein [Thermoanaerobaculia bacterium]